MKTRFGLFSRGCKCEMCKQTVCYRCHSKMRIPLEHFSNTPVFALSPTGSNGIAEEGEEEKENQPKSLLYPHGTIKEKKLSLPNSLGLLNNKSVGSAPNSPTSTKKFQHELVVNSISADVSSSPAAAGPISLPPPSIQKNKYATLPVKYVIQGLLQFSSFSDKKKFPFRSRRMSMSWLSSRERERERLEGSLLTVCSDCKDMVLQVMMMIRFDSRRQLQSSYF